MTPLRRLPSLAVLATLGLLPVAGHAHDRVLDLAIGDPARSGRTAPVVLDAVTDTADGTLLTPDEVAARLDGVRVLLVGESHTAAEFHRVQLRVIRALAERGREVIVGLEMFPRAEQAALDLWNDDPSVDEEEFLESARWYHNWGYHWNYYRDIFRFAREAGVRLVGVNAPRSVIQAVRRGGLDGLAPEERAELPERVDLDSEEHRRLFAAFFGDDDALHGGLSEEMFEGMFRAQCAWDAVMGWNAVQALQSHGGEDAIVVVLMGTGHVAYGLGARRQARALGFEAAIATLIPIPLSAEEGPPTVRASYAEFLWGVPEERYPPYPVLGISTPEQKRGEHFTVLYVTPDSVAERAGFRTGDAVLRMDGVPLDDKATLNRLMADKRWGDAARFTVLREGSELELVALFRRELDADSAEDGDAEP